MNKSCKNDEQVITKLWTSRDYYYVMGKPWVSYEQIWICHANSWASQEQVKTDNLRASPEQAMWKSWTSHEEVMKELWTSHEHAMNKSWTSYEQVKTYKSWTVQQQVVEVSW